MDKQHLRWFVRHVALVVVVVAATLVAVGSHGGLAQDAGNSNEQRPSRPGVTDPEPEVGAQAVGPSYFQVPPGAFNSDGADPDGFRIDYNYDYLRGTVNAGACLWAPLNVPIGATINGLEVFVDDQNADHYEDFYIDRINLSSGAVNIMAWTSSPAGTTSGLTKYSDYSIDHPLITKSYVYHMTTCVKTNIYFYGARIGYSLGAGSAAVEEEVDLPIVVNDN